MEPSNKFLIDVSLQLTHLLKKKTLYFFITDRMATVNVEVGQVILGDRVEDSLAENNLQGEINNYNKEIEDNQEKVGAIAV